MVSTLLITIGHQQVDPSASLGFGLTTLQILKRPKSELRFEYLDDISMAGPTQTVAADMGLLVEAAFKLDLKLNDSKCKITADDYSVTRTMTTFNVFKETPSYELTLLRALILKGKAVDEALKKKVKAFKRAISRLVLLQFHDAPCLLRNSISIPKLLFILRM